jgi:hypothetical protein
MGRMHLHYGNSPSTQIVDPFRVRWLRLCLDTVRQIEVFESQHQGLRRFYAIYPKT